MGVSWPRCLLIVALFASSNVLAMTFAQSNIPQKWKESERPLDTQQFVTLDVMLPLSNLDSLEHLLYSVSDPNSLQYGHFLEEHEADAIFRPASGCAAKVISWLESTGATHIRHNSHSVSFATTIDDANRMLNASFRAYEHESGILHIRTMHYEIPDHLTDSIDFISPTTYFGGPRSSDKPLLNPISSQDSLGTIPKECNSSFTFRGQQLQGIGPECIKALYKVNDYNASLDSGSSLAFGSFLNESASHADLLSYQAMFGIQRQSLIIELINGGKDTQPPEHDHEANLDSQILMGVAHPLPVTEFIVGGSPSVNF